MSAPILQAWCPTCREMSMPDDRGRCVWCDTQTGAAALLRPVETSDDPIRWHLRQGEPGWGPECPGCGGMKRKQSRQCATCRRANGYRGPDRSLRSHQARHITEELLYEARRLYGTGLSLNQVAARIFDRTTYASEASCSNGLHSLFRRRGWKLRPQRAVTAARNYRHGRGGRDRDEGAYRRFLREQGRGYHGAYRPTCAGVRKNYPRRGEPCRRPAIEGSDYCVSHEPGRAAAHAEHLARMRAKAGRRVGEAHPNARLTEADVLAIRARPAERVAILAAEYGVSRDLIYRIRKWQAWQHVGADQADAA